MILSFTNIVQITKNNTPPDSRTNSRILYLFENRWYSDGLSVYTYQGIIIQNVPYDGDNVVNAGPNQVLLLDHQHYSRYP